MVQSYCPDQFVIFMTSHVYLQVLLPRGGVTVVTGWASTAAHSWQVNSQFKAASALVFLHVTYTQVKVTRESSLGFSSQIDALIRNSGSASY